MPSSVTWKKNGPVAAQLFRDIYFKKFNDDTSVTEIHGCPNRPYSQLNLNTFYKHVKSTRSRVENYRQLGTGLDHEEFKLLVKLHEPPPPEDREPTSEEADLDDDEDDEDYEDGDTLGSEDDDDYTLETALRDLDLNGGKIIDVKAPSQKKKKETKQTTTTSTSKPTTAPSIMPITGDPYRDPVNMVYPDKKRILVLFEGDGDVENIESIQRIEFSECGKELHRLTKVPPTKTNALLLVGGLIEGPDPEHSEHVANLKAYMEHRVKSNKNDMIKKDENGDLWTIREKVQLAFEVEKQFFDHQDKPMDDFLIDDDGTGLFWSYLWLRGVHAKDKPTPGKKVGRRLTKVDEEKPMEVEKEDGLELTLSYDPFAFHGPFFPESIVSCPSPANKRKIDTTSDDEHDRKYWRTAGDDTSVVSA